MRVGIDYVSLGLVVAAYIVARIRTLSLRVRYSVIAILIGAVAVFRLRGGAVGMNLAFAGIAGALAAFYVYRAVKAEPRS